MNANAVIYTSIADRCRRTVARLARGPLSRSELELLDDSALIALSNRGNTRAYEILVRRYQRLVYNVCYQLVQSHETAADLTQETFIKAFKALPSFRIGTPLKPWLLKIASNAGLNKIRENKSREHDSLDAALEEPGFAEPAGSANIEHEVEVRLSQAELQSALAELPARQRHVFLLRYQHDLSYADIANVVGESESAIKSLLFRTREKLRSMLMSGEDQMRGAKDGTK